MTAKEALKLLSQDAHSDFKILTEDEREDCFYEIAQALNILRRLGQMFGYRAEKTKTKDDDYYVEGFVKKKRVLMSESCLNRFKQWQEESTVNE